MASGAAKVSPFAPASLPAVPVIDGVRFASMEAGIKYKGRRDLMIAVMDEGTVAAGVLTQSKTCSAPARSSAPAPSPTAAPTAAPAGRSPTAASATHVSPS